MKKTLYILFTGLLLVVFSIGSSLNAKTTVPTKTKTERKVTLHKTAHEDIYKGRTERLMKISGPITAVNSAANTFTINRRNKPITITTDSKTLITIAKDKRALDDLKAGFRAKVTYISSAGGDKLALKVDAKPMTAPTVKKVEKKAKKGPKGIKKSK
jgi:hypothetical protein